MTQKRKKITSPGTLPDGTAASPGRRGGRAYLAAWKAFNEKLVDALGGAFQVHAWDPDVGLYDRLTKQYYSLPLPIARRIVRLYEEWVRLLDA